MKSYEPLANLILLQVESKHEETVGGVIIPDASGEPSAIGVVMARGPSAYKSITVGSRVLFQPFLTEEVWEEGGVKMALVLDVNIFAVVEDELNGG